MFRSPQFRRTISLCLVFFFLHIQHSPSFFRRYLGIIWVWLLRCFTNTISSFFSTQFVISQCWVLYYVVICLYWGSINLLMVGLLRSISEILVFDWFMFSAFLTFVSALSLTFMLTWFGSQHRMILVFFFEMRLSIQYFASSEHVVFLFFNAISNESVKLINLCLLLILKLGQ